MDKIRVLLSIVDYSIAQDKVVADEAVELFFIQLSFFVKERNYNSTENV